jgi:hypothetical protein
MKKAVVWDLALKVQEMEVLKHCHCHTGLRLQWCCQPPSYVQELMSMQNTMTLAKINVDVIDTI